MALRRVLSLLAWPEGVVGVELVEELSAGKSRVSAGVWPCGPAWVQSAARGAVARLVRVAPRGEAVLCVREGWPWGAGQAAQLESLGDVCAVAGLVPS